MENWVLGWISINRNAGNIRTTSQGKPRYGARNQDRFWHGFGPSIILGISPVGKQGRKAITSNKAQGQSSSINTN